MPRRAALGLAGNGRAGYTEINDFTDSTRCARNVLYSQQPDGVGDFGLGLLRHRNDSLQPNPLDPAPTGSLRDPPHAPGSPRPPSGDCNASVSAAPPLGRGGRGAPLSGSAT